MKKNKLQKFTELLGFSNVYENFDPEHPKLLADHGKVVSMENGWSKDHFKNTNPLILELACGKGEYTLGLASKYKDKNFVGVDIKGARIWKGAKMALGKKLQNVVFLRTRIEQLNLFFQKGEIQEIWITFPDPFIKKENRRLTAPRFLDIYYSLLEDSGIVHLKTDSRELYEFTLEVIKNHNHWKLLNHSSNIYKKELIHPDLSFKTFYENMHLSQGKKITFISIQKA